MKLLVMGDSNSGGLYNALAGPGGRLGVGMVRSDTVLVNEARGGESSATALARIDAVVANGPYATAVVCYGGVDWLNELYGGAPAGTGMAAFDNMTAIRTALLRCTARVYCTEGVGGWVDPTADPATLALARAFRAGYFALGCKLKEKPWGQLSYATPQDPAYWSFPVDSIHLSLVGYEALAYRVLGYLRDGQGLSV